MKQYSRMAFCMPSLLNLSLDFFRKKTKGGLLFLMLCFVISFSAFGQVEKDPGGFENLRSLKLPKDNKISQINLHGLNDSKTKEQLSRRLKGIKDSVNLAKKVESWVSSQHANGQLEMSLDSLTIRSSEANLFFHQGPIYLYDSLHTDGLNELYRAKSGLDRLEKKQSPVDWEDLETRLMYCLDLFQQEGYPFAAFDKLDLIYRKKGEDTLLTSVFYRFDAGPLVPIDSIIVAGDHREKDVFIYSLIRLSPGEKYQDKLIRDIPKILNNSIYYQKVPKPVVEFTRYQTAKVKLKLERKRAGKFDLLVGILPPVDETQTLQFTGTMDVVLVSPARQGELIQIKYDKLTTTSQQLKLGLMLPYLLRTPLRVEGNFELLKQADDFLNLNTQASAWYSFSPFLSARFYYKGRSSRLLDSALVDTSANLGQLDGSRNVVGVGFTYENLDYRWNPSKGISANFEIGIGQRTLRKNQRINDEIYDGLDLVQPTQEINFSLKWYKQLFPRHVLHIANHSYWLGLDNYFRNDQLQVGGSKSIRGFNELEFFTDFYTFFTAEYRLQLERDSYIFLFGDFAYMEDHFSNTITRPSGVGLGMNYGTKAGIISISYAIGRTRDISFAPSRGKVHIGLINQF